MNVSPRPVSRPDCRSGTRKGHVPGMGANTARRVRLFKQDERHREGEIHGEVHPDHRDGAARSGAGHGVHDGGVGPDRLDHALGTPSAGGLQHLCRTGREAGVDRLRPERSARASRSGTTSTAKMRAGPKSDAHCSAMIPTGPRPTTTTLAPGWMDARSAPRYPSGGCRSEGRPLRRRRLREWGGRRGRRMAPPWPRPGRRADRASSRTLRSCRRGRRWAGRPGRPCRCRTRSHPRPAHGRPRFRLRTCGPTSATVPMAS